MSNPDPACHTTISQGGLAADVVYQPGSWFNVCAFAQPPLVQVDPFSPPIPLFGSAGRNIMVGPAFWDLDLAVTKTIPLRSERQRIQFRGEFFNLANHPNLDIPNHSFGSPTFGQVLSANVYGNKPPRQIQLGLRYIF